MAEKNYQIASINKAEEAAIKKETGKDFVIIAWEK